MSFIPELKKQFFVNLEFIDHFAVNAAAFLNLKNQVICGKVCFQDEKRIVLCFEAALELVEVSLKVFWSNIDLKMRFCIWIAPVQLDRNGSNNAFWKSCMMLPQPRSWKWWECNVKRWFLSPLLCLIHTRVLWIYLFYWPPKHTSLLGRCATVRMQL